MNINGYPNLLQTALYDRTVTATKLELDITAQEVVTGRRANLAKHLGGQAGEYNLVTKALSDIDSDRTRMDLAESRFAQVDIALDSIRLTVTGFAEQAQSDFTVSGNVGREQTRESARSHLETVVLMLNNSHAGRGLFSGDESGSAAMAPAQTILDDIDALLAGATDEASIDAAIDAYFVAGAGFDTTAYTGGTGDAASVRLPNGTDVDYNVRADNQAFRDTVEGLLRTIYAPDDASTDYIADFTTALTRGEEALIALQADVGRQRNLISNAIEINEQERIVLSETEYNLAGVDQYEAATQLEMLEVQLEAAYTITSRLSRLSLANYL